jgi:hypothetical protein
VLLKNRKNIAIKRRRRRSTLSRGCIPAPQAHSGSQKHQDGPTDSHLK